ncbi:MAG: Isoprenylcysteine carboxyl methyltransferase (ICMT) family protein [Syntrophorhabdus sp. PtaU1.Bin050]|nr:MAG: Isoprenylcysteine carboxyl methyltransferase (ICMT) family protein [Syntrophorhabdus sp. PtaU1.Bin050]
MIKKLIQGLLVSTLIVSVPVMGNPAMLYTPHLWIMVLIGLLASLFQPAYNPFKRSPNVEDKGTANQIIWSIYFTQLSVLIEAAYFRYPESISWNMITAFALVLMAAGLAIRTWAVFTLGKHFTWHISIQENQPIISTGPYAFVRHPGYFGAFLTYTGTALFLKTWLSLVLSVVVLLFTFLRRIYHEEKVLKRSLGSKYDAYCKSVKSFIPGIW